MWLMAFPPNQNFLSSLSPVDLSPVKRSPAKINLCLKIGGRLSSGFHEVATVIAPIKLFDSVELELSDTSQSSCSVEFGSELTEVIPQENLAQFTTALSSAENNLAAKAAKLVLNDLPFDLRIKKNIPLEAGLGGGSGNAAVVLQLANSLREFPLKSDELYRIGATIGSDVEPMMYQKPVLHLQKEGSQSVSPIKLNDDIASLELLLVKPPIGTSSAEAYKMLGRGTASEYKINILDRNNEFRLENDFEEVFNSTSWYKQAIEVLGSLGARSVVLSGSGSTVVGFFSPGTLSPKSVFEAKNALKKWWVYRTEFCR